MTKNLIPFKIEDLEILRLGINGEGIGKYQDCIVFVDGALPQERVSVTIYEWHKKHCRGRVDHFLVTSPDRIAPACPLFGKCGGCQLMHLPYSKQLEFKQKQVQDALERIGNFSSLQVEPCLSSKKQLHYRNKIQLPIKPHCKTLTLGLYAKGTHDIIQVDQCFIHLELGEQICQKVKTVLQDSSLTPYQTETGKGELRHLLIKTAVFTEQVLIILITAQKEIKGLKTLANKILDLDLSVKGVVQNVNSSKTGKILGERYEVLAGQGYIEEKLLGLLFKVSPASFFQVNPFQVEDLYQLALTLASLTKEKVVLDAYCGIGVLSLLMAVQAKKVIGIECVKEAIADAKENAKNNHIENAYFLCDFAEQFIQTTEESFDLVLLNPPRKGCERSLLEKLLTSSVKEILYISCDPATLARDLRFLSKHFQIDKVQPFDMFPQTAHVESLVRLIRIC